MQQAMLKLRGRSSISVSTAGGNKLSFDNLRCHGCGRSDNLLTFVFCHKCGKPAGHHSCVTLQGRPICGPCRGANKCSTTENELPYWTKGSEFMKESRSAHTSPVFAPISPANQIEVTPLLEAKSEPNNNTSPPQFDLSNLPPPPAIPGLTIPRHHIEGTPNKVPLIPPDQVDAVVNRAIKALDAMLPALESPNQTPKLGPRPNLESSMPALPPAVLPKDFPMSPPGTPGRSYPSSRVNSRPGSPNFKPMQPTNLQKQRWAQYVSESLPPIFKLPPKVQRASSVPPVTAPTVGLGDATIIQNLVVNQHYYNGPHSPYVGHNPHRTMTGGHEPGPSDTDSEGEYIAPALVGSDLEQEYSNKRGVKRPYKNGIKQEQIEPDPKRRRVAKLRRTTPKKGEGKDMRRRSGRTPAYVRRYPARRAPRTKTSASLEQRVADSKIGPEGYECQEPGCGKKVRLKCHFTRHLKLHSRSISERRPHKCPMCTRRFAQRCNLKAHISTHKQNRHQPFSCKVCGLTFTRKHGVKRHIERRHKSNRTRVDKLIVSCAPSGAQHTPDPELPVVKVEECAAAFQRRQRKKKTPVRKHNAVNIKVEEDMDIPQASLDDSSFDDSSMVESESDHPME